MKVEVSARHVHLSQKDMEKLFGKSYEPKILKELSQPKELAYKETVTLENKGNKIENVRFLGPVRGETQVELSTTDCFKIKIKPTLRLSGNHKDTPGITIIGPKGKIKIKKGVIVAKRHVHCSDKEAKKLKIKNNQKVSIHIKGERGTIFDNFIVRVNPEFKLSAHIDTDEGNAAGMSMVSSGELLEKV